MASSPNNYQIGKGILYFRKDGEVDFADMGNCSSLKWSPSVEKLDHFSSREGVKTKDKSVAVTSAATLEIVLDEITADNLELFLLGERDVDSEGNSTIKSMQLSAVRGTVKFIGSNDVGKQVEFIGDVDIVPDGEFNLISEEWNELTLNCEMVSHDDYGLGLFTVKDAP